VIQKIVPGAPDIVYGTALISVCRRVEIGPTLTPRDADGGIDLVASHI
jgi:hypothetical protein